MDSVDPYPGAHGFEIFHEVCDIAPDVISGYVGVDGASGL